MAKTPMVCSAEPPLIAAHNQQLLTGPAEAGAPTAEKHVFVEGLVVHGAPCETQPSLLRIMSGHGKETLVHV